MKKRKNISLNKLLAKILAVISALLVIVGFLLPPTGVIDNSVFIGVGELTAIQALFLLWDIVDKGKKGELKHGNTTLTINE